VNKTAIIILNRNLPLETDALVENLISSNGDKHDIFVVEAGSDQDNISKYCTWHVNTLDVIKNGMRYSRGMNYGLLQLWKNNEWEKYNSFFLITNDTKFPNGQKTIETLQKLLKDYPRVGLISPCSSRWGEKELIGPNSLKYFWFIHNNAYFFRKELLDDLINKESPDYQDFLFDGNNFRGYLSESEIIAKSYANDWAAAITTKVYAEEDESFLIDKSNLIKTESYDENIELYVNEGLSWAKRKYGFNSRWQMMQFSKLFYDKFFDYFPVEKKYRI
jgi:hypothetical protein